MLRAPIPGSRPRSKTKDGAPASGEAGLGASPSSTSLRRAGMGLVTAGVSEAAAEGTNRLAAQSSGREVVETMREGMRELLGHHSLDELSILCDDVGVGVGGTASKEERIDLLFRDVLTSCPKYHMLLARIWEGIILEYWRGLGKEIKSYKYNIRNLVMDWWNRGRVIEVKSSEFQPVFAGIATTGTTEAVLSHGVKVAAGEKVAEAVAELRELETDVKECERRIRFGRDFDSIMDYFASMGALRRREAELRDSLIMDLALVEKTMQESVAEKEKAEEAATRARTERLAVMSNISALKFANETQAKKMKRGEDRIAELEKEVETLKLARERDREAKGSLEETLQKTKDTLTDTQGRLKTKTLDFARLQDRLDASETRRLEVEKQLAAATEEVETLTLQVERLLVEASAAESVAELLFTEAVSEDVANTMTLAGLDVVTQVVRRSYRALEAAAAQSPGPSATARSGAGAGSSGTGSPTKSSRPKGK